MQPDKKYSNFKKKHKDIPDLRWLIENFKIKLEEEDEDVLFLDQIRNEVIEKLDVVIKNILGPVVSSSDDYSTYIEGKMLSEKQKKDIFEMYKEFQSLFWEANKLGAVFDEKDFAHWLVKVKMCWEKNKHQIENICNTFSEGWKEYKKTDSETLYHG